MHAPAPLRTDRLRLVPASAPLLAAELAGTDRLAPLLAARIPSSWPPGEYDADALRFFLAELAAHPEQEGWLSWYVVQLAQGPGPAHLIGAAGFLGPPDAQGAVEVGYSLVPEARGQGLAVEAVAALAAHALAQPGVREVVARTAPDNAASISVLARCGFRPELPAGADGQIRHVRRREP